MSHVLLLQPDSHNVPDGDPAKVVERQTTMNVSFKDVSDKNVTSRYNIEDVSRVLNQTNFKQHDGHFKWNDYNSTATASYRPATIPGTSLTLRQKKVRCSVQWSKKKVRQNWDQVYFHNLFLGLKIRFYFHFDKIFSKVFKTL